MSVCAGRNRPLWLWGGKSGRQDFQKNTSDRDSQTFQCRGNLLHHLVAPACLRDDAGDNVVNAIVDGSMSVIFNRSNRVVGEGRCVGRCVAPSCQAASKVWENPERYRSAKSSSNNTRHSPVSYLLRSPYWLKSGWPWCWGETFLTQPWPS